MLFLKALAPSFPRTVQRVRCRRRHDLVRHRRRARKTLSRLRHGDLQRESLEKGNISFVPDDPKSVGATGIIENGSYALSTGGGKDGARAGKYKVTVTAREDSSAKAKADFEKVSKGQNPGRVPGQFLAKAEGEAKSLIPTGYGDVRRRRTSRRRSRNSP